MYKIILAIVICVSILCCPLFATDTSTSIFESVVKVYNPGGSDYGTGNCINKDANNVYIITNNHVVGNSKQVYVKFYREGHESQNIEAYVVWKAYRADEPVDIALLAVNIRALGWSPPVVHFSLSNEELKPGDTHLTIGCPEAGWPRAYKGHIVDVKNGCYYLTPTVIPGQSGSVIFNAEGTKAVGLVAWYEGKYGKAMTSEVIRKAVNGKETGYIYKQTYGLPDQDRLSLIKSTTYIACCQNECGPNIFGNCGPDGCGPGGNCGPGILQGRNQGLRQNRQNPNPNQSPNQNQDEDNGGGDKIFPTYPGDNNDDGLTPKNDKPKTPVVPLVDNTRVDSLDKKVIDLDKSVKDVTKSADDLTKKVTDIDIKLNKSVEDPKIAELTTKLETTSKDLVSKLDEANKKVEGLVSDLDKKADKIDLTKQVENVAVPLKVVQENMVKSIDVNKIADGLSKGLQTLNERIDQSMLKQTEVTASFMEKAVTKVNPPVSVVSEDATAKAVSVGIPAGVVLVIGWWFRNVALKWVTNYAQSRIPVVEKKIEDYLDKRLGGASANPTPPVQVT